TCSCSRSRSARDTGARRRFREPAPAGGCPGSMNRIAVVMVGAALCGCRSLEPSNSADAGGRRTAKAQAEETAGGRFYARGPSGDDHELKLHRLTVDVTTRPGTVRSHLTMEIATAV